MDWYEKGMLKVSLIFAIFFFVFPAYSYQADIESTLLRGQELGFQRKYDDAIAVFKGLQSNYPDSPAGYLGELLIYQVKMLENEDLSQAAKFEETYNRAKQIYERAMQNQNIDSFDLMLCAGIIGLEGMHAARKHEWWLAYKRGTLSRQILSRIKKNDPTFADADIGRGLYLYWRSVFAKMVPVLSAFFSDKKKEGIELLNNVMANGRLAKKFAHVNLGIIELEEKKYDSAIEIFSYFINQYPQNVLMKNFRGRAYLLSKRYDQSLKDFEEILKIDDKVFKAHYFIGLANYRIGKEKYSKSREEFNKLLSVEKDRLWRSYCYYWLGRISDEEGNKEEAIKYFKEAYSLNKGLKDAEFRLHALGSGI